MKEELLDQLVNDVKSASKFAGSDEYMCGVNDALYTVLRKSHLNRYFLPEGSSEIFQILQSGLKGDTERVRKNIKKFIDKYPDNPYTKTFKNILNDHRPLSLQEND